MVPIPQYPLYSATLAEYGMEQVMFPISLLKLFKIFCLQPNDFLLYKTTFILEGEILTLLLLIFMNIMIF